MKRIKASQNPQGYPNRKVESIECRKRDLIVRIADWTRTKDAPYYDVETYVGGIYSQEHSGQFLTKQEATTFASAKMIELL